MSKTGATSTIKNSYLRMWDNSSFCHGRVKAKMWNGASFIDIPISMWTGGGYTILNEGRYQTTWFADWSETYADLNLSESHKDHGNKRYRKETLQYKKGYHFMYQGWWSSDPHGKMGSLFGFREDLIRQQLQGAVIEKVELYIRNVHSYYSSGQTAHVYKHNYTDKPGRIKKSEAFPGGNKLGSWKYYRGASVQRTDSPATAKVDWNTGYGTGLNDYGTSGLTIEGSGNQKKTWIVLSNSIGEDFKHGRASGFGIFENAASSQGQSYGYWCGAELTPQQYKDMESTNRINGFDVNVAWKPQLRITYRKLNG